MSLFAWDQKYSVHNTQIDGQHQELFRLANELHEAMTRGLGRDRIGQTLTRLISYTRSHFESEEGLMRSTKYPDYTAHKKEHDDLTKQVLQLKAEFDAGEQTVTMETMQFLRNWLDKHIRISDSKIAAHVSRNQQPSVGPFHAAPGRPAVSLRK
jgi:hemerythrin